MNTTCPHCQTRVNVGTDGKCPMCRRAIVAAEEAFDIVDSVGSPTTANAEFVCPMCGSDLPSHANSCPNCGENFVSLGGDLWRDGKQFLIMHKTAELPFRCVKSNRICDRKLKRSLSWHHPGWYLLVIGCGVIPYLIAALIVRKTATIHVGLSEEWFARRRKAILIGCSSVVMAVVMVIAGGATVEREAAVGATLIFGGILLFLVGIIFALVRSRIVEVKKFEGDYIWLKGCHPDYLALLPEWAGRMH